MKIETTVYKQYIRQYAFSYALFVRVLCFPTLDLIHT